MGLALGLLSRSEAPGKKLRMAGQRLDSDIVLRLDMLSRLRCDRGPGVLGTSFKIIFEG